MALDLAALSLLSQLLDAALELPADQLEAWLAALPPDQRALAPHLREMLAQRRSTGAAAFLAGGPRLDADDAATAHAGDRVGPWRLVEEIGRGGMGSVWLAERADGAYQRQVALKLPRLAWDTGLADRMAREREIGARLEHPAIARLYDAGVDERGRPYLALEYIAGQPIDAWCGGHGLDVRARLRLFVQVARAVAYAHGRLVVHRDLKPSNVLVSPDGQAHLLDFGIAKLLGDGAAESALTQEQGRLMTPSYASPEQIAGEPVSVQTDVYSLGVLLFELLTGELPHAPRRRTLGAVEDAILEGDLPLASRRAREPASARTLRGELDAILAKSLQRDPARRYASADAFADDVERYLDGEPVAARASTAAYRWRKAARRHWVGVSAIAAVMLAIVSGGGAALVQAHRANAEAERARLVNEFVFEMFNAHGGDQSLAQMPAQALLERGARQIDTRFAGQPLLQAQLYGVVSQMYFNLSEFEQAVDFGQRQLQALAAAGEHGKPVAQASLALGESMLDLWHWKEADVQFKRAIDLGSDDRDLLVRAHAQRAFVLDFGLAQDDDAARELDIAEALMAHHDVAPISRATARIVRGWWMADHASLDAAIPLFDEAIRLAIQQEGPTSRTAMHARTGLAARLVFGNRSKQARPYVDAALAAMRSVGGAADARAVVEETRFEGWMYIFDGFSHFKDVASIIEHDRRMLESRPWPVPAHVLAEVDMRLGLVYLRWGDFAHGRMLTQRAMPGCMAHAEGLTARNVCELHLALADMWTGASAEADTTARQFLEEEKTVIHGPDLEEAYMLRADAQMQDRRYADARATYAEYDALPGVAQAQATNVVKTRMDWDDTRDVVALELGLFDEVLARTARRKPAPANRYDDAVFLARAAALCGKQRHDEALALFADALPRFAVDRSETSPQLAYWRARLGLCAHAAGRARLARESATLASAALAAQPDVSRHLRAPVDALAAALGAGHPGAGT